MRESAKAVARAIATIAVAPALVSFFIRRAVVGPDQAIEGSTQGLSLIPGRPGDYLRGAFLRHALGSFDPTAVVQFGTIFSQADARIDARVYVGPHCHLGLVHIEADVLLASGVHIPSGGATHALDDLDRPIRDHPGQRTRVRVGQGAWIGSNAVVLADVGAHSV